MKFQFKNNNTLDSRKKESQKIKNKYSDRVPVVCEIDPKDRADLHLDKNKYLVPMDLTAVQFLYVLRKRLSLKSEQALFLFVGKKHDLMTSGDIMSSIYAEYADKDGFLYVMACSENTFG